MWPYPVRTDNFYKFLSHLGDLRITTVCVGTAVVIAQVIDTISNLYDCNRSVRILTIYPISSGFGRTSVVRR